MVDETEVVEVDSLDADSMSVLKAPANFEIQIKTIAIEDIVIPESKKEGRTETVIGLTGVVEEFGVATPIHVLKLGDDTEEDEDEDTLYLILDGVRRIFSATKVGISSVIAVVWVFEDVEEGKDMANLISLMLNRSQKMANKEMWAWQQTLEKVNSASVGSIEYYLQYTAGDAMKLKDVMESEYDEIKGEFLEGLLTIEGAYKKLASERKKENRLFAEENSGIDAGDSSLEDNETPRLSSEAVMQMLEMDTGEEYGNDIEELNQNKDGELEVVDAVFVQDPKNRKPLDAVLRAKVLERDEYKCQCCTVGGMLHLHLMDIHHVIQVSQGGMDSLENLVTLCINCHHTVHVYAWGKLQMNKKDMDSLVEPENEKFKEIFKLGNKIIQAEKLRKGSASAQRLVPRKMPATGYKDNLDAYKTTEA